MCVCVSAMYYNFFICIAPSNEATLPSNSELQETIKKMYVENADNLDEITTIKIPNQVSIGMLCSKVAQSNTQVSNVVNVLFYI